MAAAFIGLFAAPAQAADLAYDCTGTVRPFTLTVSAAGTVAGTPTVGDPVTLDGFQVTMTGAEAQFSNTHVVGNFVDFSVSATDGQGGDAGSATATGIDIDTQADQNGALSLTIPAAPQSLSGFTATAEGPMTFHLPDQLVADLQIFLGGTHVDNITITCVTDDSTFATVDVSKPADDGDGGTSNQGGDDGDKNPPPDQNKPPTNGNSPSPSPSHTTAPTGTHDDTSARTLANTGVPYTIPMTATGAALLVAGAVMLVAARRRRRVVVGGAPTED